MWFSPSQITAPRSEICITILAITHFMIFKLTVSFLNIWKIFGYDRWRSWLRHCATRRKVPASTSGMAVGNFQVIYSFCPHSAHLTSNRNEYQGIFLGVQYGRSVQLTTLPSSCAECQSKDRIAKFHSSSKSSWLATGKVLSKDIINTNLPLYENGRYRRSLKRGWE